MLKLIHLIEREYVSTNDKLRPMDLSRVVTFFTLDVISAVAFGRPLGFLDANSDPFDYLEQIKTWLPGIMTFGVYPELRQILRLPFVGKLMPKTTDPNGMGKIMG